MFQVEQYVVNTLIWQLVRLMKPLSFLICIILNGYIRPDISPRIFCPLQCVKTTGANETPTSRATTTPALFAMQTVENMSGNQKDPI